MTEQLRDFRLQQIERDIALTTVRLCSGSLQTVRIAEKRLEQLKSERALLTAKHVKEAA